MKKHLFLFILFINTIAKAASLADTTAITAIKYHNHKLYALSKNTIWEWKQNKLLPYCESKEEIVDYLPFGNKMLICTSKSLQIATDASLPITIAQKLDKVEFVSLCIGPKSEVLIATRFNGVFALVADTLKSYYSAFPINTILSTSDSSFWVGTDVGLHKLNNGKLNIFKEEGVSNFEIADNHIAKLIPDNLGDMWVKMTENVSVISVNTKAEHHEHLPTIKYIGSASNELYSVTYHQKLGYLFSTTQGMLLMPLGKKEDNHKYFEMAEEIAQEGPNNNLGVLKRVYYNGKPLMSNFHLLNGKTSITTAIGNKLLKIKINKLKYK